MSNKTGFCRIFLDLPLLPSIRQTGVIRRLWVGFSRARNAQRDWRRPRGPREVGAYTGDAVAAPRAGPRAAIVTAAGAFERGDERGIAAGVGNQLNQDSAMTLGPGTHGSSCIRTFAGYSYRYLLTESECFKLG